METKIKVDRIYEGDENTRFFHHFTTFRRKMNSIMTLKINDRQWLYER